MSTPSSPSFNAISRESRRKWLFGRLGPWQRKQEFSKIGAMSRAKSIFLAAAAGSLPGSSGGSAARAEPRTAQAATKAVSNSPAAGLCLKTDERLFNRANAG